MKIRSQTGDFLQNDVFLMGSEILWQTALKKRNTMILREISLADCPVVGKWGLHNAIVRGAIYVD
ncbi:MAG: hypothetical protein GX316_00280 [Firmicutes bacterium]|nr:hypothetical protein [Bacillota bacterium]